MSGARESLEIEPIERNKARRKLDIRDSGSGRDDDDASGGDAGAADGRAVYNAWVERVLGYSVPVKVGKGKGRKKNRTYAITPVPPPVIPGAGDTYRKVDATVGTPNANATKLYGNDATQRRVLKRPDGGIVYSAPPPPIAEVTFSGGGGKGAVLPGAVGPLEARMKDINTVRGASVGSLTAALVAVGIKEDAFNKLSDDPATAATILHGKTLGELRVGLEAVGKMAHLTTSVTSTDGLQGLAEEQMGKALSATVDEFLQSAAGQQLAANDKAAIADIMKKCKPDRGPGSRGLTFGDLRTLHRYIPRVKEVEVAGTMIGDNMGEKGPGKKIKDKGKPQAMMFNAEMTPDVEIAAACAASAAIPPVFKPKEIDLGGGRKGRFIDGGVMNNAPASNTVQAERNVDPMPQSSRVTLVFEDEEGDAEKLKQGVKAIPERNGINDRLTKAENSASEYRKDRLLADAPDDVVKVPLKFKYGQNADQDADLTGLFTGTMQFTHPQDVVDAGRAATKQALQDRLDQHDAPKAVQFQSVQQMLTCIPESELQALADDDFQADNFSAKDELKFRQDALANVDHLLAAWKTYNSVNAVPAKKGESDQNKAQREQANKAAEDAAKADFRNAQGEYLGKLRNASRKSPDRQAFVGRELARHVELEVMLTNMAKDGCPSRKDSAKTLKPFSIVKAGAAVNESLKAQAHAQNVLQYLIYPKMMRFKEPGRFTRAAHSRNNPRFVVLQQADDKLRAARTTDAVNEAIRLVVKTYATKTNGKPKDSKFAKRCEAYLVKKAA